MGVSTLGNPYELHGELVAQVERGDLLGEIEAALGELAQVASPLVLDVPVAPVEGELQGAARTVAPQARGEHVAGVGPALALEQVEDCAAEDDRVPRRGREFWGPAVAKPGADGRPEQEDLARVVLSRALDQPGPLQIAQEPPRPPRRRQALVVR